MFTESSKKLSLEQDFSLSCEIFQFFGSLSLDDFVKKKSLLYSICICKSKRRLTVNLSCICWRMLWMYMVSS